MELPVLLPPPGAVPPPFFCALVNLSNSAAASDLTAALSKMAEKIESSIIVLSLNALIVNIFRLI